MDNMRRYRRPQHRHTNENVDGFLSPNRFKKPMGSIGFPDKKQPTIEQNQKIDDFNRPSGYHPSNISLSGTETSQPLLPDGPRRRPLDTSHLGGGKPPKKHRRFFHRPKSWKQLFKRTALTIMAVVLLISGYLGYQFYRTQKKVFSGGGHAIAICDGDIPVDELHKEGDARVNVLLVGIGGPGHDGPDLTDTIIIASVDTLNKKVDLLSIPRDLWVKQSGGGASKINAVYPFAKQASKGQSLTDQEKDGLKALDQKVSSITGIDIHYNVLVDFKAFKSSVDAVGGVTVNVPETLYDPTIAWENHNNPVIASKGEQTFNGPKALLYAKSRETSSDFARSERQRLLLVALKEKVLSLGTYSNPVKVSGLLNSLGSNVYTDFDLTSVKCLYKQVSEIPSSNIKSLDMVKPPNSLLTTGNINGQSIVQPRAGLFDYSEIQTFVGSTLRDSALAKENANILILNGTSTADLASKEAAQLKRYGYNVGKVGDAPNQDYQKTILVDLRNGVNKYTKHYLENRLGVKATNKLPDSSISPGSADFVIILGTDAFDQL